MNDSIDFSELILGEQIGENEDVREAQYHDKLVVVKTYLEPVEREFKQLKNACHENIIFVYGIAKNKNVLYLVMEYMDGGSLDSLLHAGEVNYYFAHVINWAYQIAKALAYLHNRKPKAVIHRDLTPKCIQLSDNRRDAKIFDLTHVRDLASTMTKHVGTGAYMAPEIFEGNSHSEKSDVYCWAITLWEMLSRKKPFKDVANVDLGRTVLSGKRPPLDELMAGVPEEIITLMTDCWSLEPGNRKSMNEVLAVLEKYYKVLIRDELRL